MEQPVLLCLHGWGGSKESFAELRKALEGAPVTILAPDLPGFGSEPEPLRPWTVTDYALWVEKWLEKQHLPQGTPLLLLGHSHGGRIAIKIASRGIVPVKHLFLCAAAGIPERKPLKHAFGWVLAKGGKALLGLPGISRLQPLAKRTLYRLLRVHDYEQASPVMRETLRLVKAEDLRPLLPLLTVQTDLFWGAKDGKTPLRNGKEMHALIAKSRLHVFPDAHHGVHRDHAEEISAVIRQNIALSPKS